MGKLNINEIKEKSIQIIEPDFSYIDGKYLREFRMKMKMSQSLMADYLGVSKKAIENRICAFFKKSRLLCFGINEYHRYSDIFSIIRCL